MIAKRMYLMFLGVLLLLGHSAKSQELLPVLYDSTVVNHQLSVNSSLFYHSTSLSNELSNKIIFGGDISDELSKDVFDEHNEYNRIGGGAKFRIAYKAAGQVFKSKPNWGWMIEASNEIHASSDYSSDIVGLALLGNASYLGETVTFSNSSAEFVQFLSLGAGIHDRKTKNFISLNVVLPQNYVQLFVNKGSASFSEDGSNVDLRVQGELMEAISSPYFKGAGGAVNFDFNIPFGIQEAFNGIIKFTGRNIGAYHLINSKFQEVDATISYSGFSIDDFTSETGIASFKDTLGVLESESSSTRLLPGFIQVGKVASVHSTKKLQSTFGVRMYTNVIYRPMVYLGLHYQPRGNFSFGTQGSFGGYGNFRLGLYANYSGDKMMIGLGTEDLLGALLKSQYGQSGLIRLAWKF
ncbi:hypothetical protein [Brumimicrobium mesophilum]|uniref:hypothetical protein n=1 Tax=Brumimicrobium mesophilum TaxID=392717 RepID=UPI000D13FDBE|nr:hypothetical protein [Brumimicrobium mesophilum]